MDPGSGLRASAAAMQPISRPSRELSLGVSPAPTPGGAGDCGIGEEEGFIAGMFWANELEEDEGEEDEGELESEVVRLSAGSRSSEEEEEEDSDGPFDRLKDTCGGSGCCGVCCGLACCILVITLLICSLAGIEATQYGLKRNAMTAVVDYSEVYQGGRHLIGFYNNFITFPSTLQTIEWNGKDPAVTSTRDEAPMQMRTRSGIMVDLSIAVQYQIVKESVSEMYQDYKLAVEQNFVSMLRSGISDLVQNHATSDLWVHRLTMQELLLEKCREICASQTAGMKGYVTCWNLQLHGVNIPDNVENSVIQKQVQEQNADLEQNRQTAALIRAATSVRLAEFDRSIGIVQAGAAANAYEITQLEVSQQLLAWREARATAITVTHDEMPALSNDQLVRYFELKGLIDSVNSSLAYGNIDTAFF